MRCPNCRCTVANNLSICNYCGYEFASGSAKTLTVAQIQADEYDVYGITSPCVTYQSDNVQYTNYSTDNNVVSKLLLLAAVCIALIICTLTLLIL